MYPPLLFNYLKAEHRLEEAVVKMIIEEAVKIETVFITKSIRCAMLGMNVAMMKQYVRFVGDRLMRLVKFW